MVQVCVWDYIPNGTVRQEEPRCLGEGADARGCVGE